MENTNLGKCCICEISGKTVRNLMTLHLKTLPDETKGGWGCFVCDLPPSGAVAVLCDVCLFEYTADNTIIKFACLGYPGENRRIEIEKLTEVYEHDKSKHPETWDWNEALRHFRAVRQIYQDFVSQPGANTSFALEYLFRPLSTRYHRGERTLELFEAMKAVE